jgi:Zn-dependent protease with chaperone function
VHPRVENIIAPMRQIGEGDIMLKNVIIATVATATVATVVEAIREMKAVGAKKEDFITHAEIVSGTYMGERKTWNVNGVNVIGVYSPVTVATSKALYASANYDAYGNVVMVYDKNFAQLSEDEQYAIACHEAGHIHYKHDWRVRKLENELQADAYAVSIVGRETMLSTLNKILSRKKRDKELVARINAI